MKKLYFRYGTMNSSKTANLLMVAHNYHSQNRKVLLVKPDIDNRFGFDIIKSRALEGMKADVILHSNDTAICVNMENVDCVLVDECQFMSEKNIDALRNLTEFAPVICYGLRTDYRGRLFTGSKRLFEVADTIEEIKTICVNCNKKAIINAKFSIVDNTKTILHDGSCELELGAEEKYQPMCWNCWKN